MLQLSEKLSKDIPFARTDFYIVNGKLYFGITENAVVNEERVKSEKYKEMLQAVLQRIEALN